MHKSDPKKEGEKLAAHRGLATETRALASAQVALGFHEEAMSCNATANLAGDGAPANGGGGLVSVM